MVTIIGQIQPWGFLKTITKHFIEDIEGVLLSSCIEIKLGDVGVCQEWIWNIAKGSVKCSSSAYWHIHNSGYTGRKAWTQCCSNSINTPEQSSNTIFRSILNLMFWICEYHELNQLNEENLVFADEVGWNYIIEYNWKYIAHYT
jgi:hypothetical protein